MLHVIRTTADLPREGTAHEHARIDFKRQVDDLKDLAELAKDVAAFANSVGGTVLVGAERDGERLKRYVPMAEDMCASTMKAFDEAVRNLCSPKPLVEMYEIAQGGGLVLAVNVWAFPAQPVGVAFGEKSTARAKAFWFPHRSGAHVGHLTPEQLPMMMLPEIRRVAILLSQIPVEARGKVTLEGIGPVPVGVQFRREVSLELDLDGVSMRNTVLFKDSLGQSLAVPADTIKHVWHSVATDCWIITARVALREENKRQVVIPYV